MTFDHSQLEPSNFNGLKHPRDASHLIKVVQSYIDYLSGFLMEDLPKEKQGIAMFVKLVDDDEIWNLIKPYVALFQDPSSHVYEAPNNFLSALKGLEHRLKPRPEIHTKPLQDWEDKIRQTIVKNKLDFATGCAAGALSEEQVQARNNRLDRVLGLSTVTEATRADGTEEEEDDDNVITIDSDSDEEENKKKIKKEDKAYDPRNEY